MSNKKVETYTISDEMRKKIEALKDSTRAHFKEFTEEEDAIILEYYVKKNKEELAKALGSCAETVKKRYKVLTENKNE